MSRRVRRQRGFFMLLVGVGLVAISLAAGIGAAVINHAENRHTVNTLTDPDAKSKDIDAITDQQIANARSELPNSAALATNLAGLGGLPLGDGQNAAEVAGSAIAQVAVGTVEPAAIDYMSDPSSSWNRNGGKDRPTEGTRPTGGKIPDGPSGGSDGGVAAPDMAKCPDYSKKTVGYCAGENGCAGPNACPCAPGSEFCCIPGFCYTRDIAGCQQERCPNGVGRHENDTCACDAPRKATYDPCRNGYLLSCTN